LNYPKIDLNAPSFIASTPAFAKIPVVASFNNLSVASLMINLYPYAFALSKIALESAASPASLSFANIPV